MSENQTPPSENQDPHAELMKSVEADLNKKQKLMPKTEDRN